jgi:hypothetical protein
MLSGRLRRCLASTILSAYASVTSSHVHLRSMRNHFCAESLSARVRPLTGKRQTIVSLSSVSLQSANAAAAFLWEGVRCVGLLYLRAATPS